jgi:hypothetical protein
MLGQERLTSVEHVSWEEKGGERGFGAVRGRGKDDDLRGVARDGDEVHTHAEAKVFIHFRGVGDEGVGHGDFVRGARHGEDEGFLGRCD